MKKFWLFAYQQCYPYGGMEDFKGDFDTIEECEKAFDSSKDEWYHIFDFELKRVVFDSYVPNDSEYLKNTYDINNH